MAHLRESAKFAVKGPSQHSQSSEDRSDHRSQTKRTGLARQGRSCESVRGAKHACEYKKTLVSVSKRVVLPSPERSRTDWGHGREIYNVCDWRLNNHLMTQFWLKLRTAC